MFPLKFIRENKALIIDAVKKKGEKVDVEKLLSFDKDRRDILGRLELLKHTRNEKSKEVGILKKQQKDNSALIRELQETVKEIKALGETLKKVESEIDNLLIWVPNIPHSSVKDEPVIIREWGEKKEFTFSPLDHFTLGGSLGWFDFQKGAKIAGSHFPLYKGFGATLERALINYMLDLHIKHHNYIEIFPPFLAKEECMFGTGQIPKLKEDMYMIEQDNLYLNPTAEVPLTNIHRDEVIDGKDLPIKYTAYTACFRREAGSYGKETKGLMRLHQFNKVEMVNFTLPDESYKQLEILLNEAEAVLKELNLPYRVVQLPLYDLSFASAKTYDIEVWAPVSEKWLEVSSVSNFEAFQARRANIRYNLDGKRGFVHTLNGSGVATPRTMIAILENYQKEDGTIDVPEVLKTYIR